MEIVVDAMTPDDEKLCAKYKKSFAYLTVTERLPVIVTSIIDTLVRDKNQLEGESKEESKRCIGELSELKYCLQTAKPLLPFTSDEPDTQIWNEHLERYSSAISQPLTFYNGPWLFVECYLYRRIREIFANSDSLKNYDPFSDKKQTVLKKSLAAMEPVFRHLIEDKVLDSQPMKTADLIDEFVKLFKMCLWANRVDLSLSSGSTEECSAPTTDVDQWNDLILVDDTHKVLDLIFSSTDQPSHKLVDFVLDNCGVELLSDLCLADYLVTRCGVDKVRLRLKRIPWFVSDVIPVDLTHTLQACSTSQSSACSALATRWQRYMDSGKWEVCQDDFWTYGLPLDEMSEAAPQLYSELESSSLVILKGDLNYRKLVQDTYWSPGTQLSRALGRFTPAPLVAVRTLKADTVAGIPADLFKSTGQTSPDWMVSGRYGLVQFHSPH